MNKPILAAIGLLSVCLTCGHAGVSRAGVSRAGQVSEVTTALSTASAGQVSEAPTDPSTASAGQVPEVTIAPSTASAGQVSEVTTAPSTASAGQVPEAPTDPSTASAGQVSEVTIALSTASAGQVPEVTTAPSTASAGQASTRFAPPVLPENLRDASQEQKAGYLAQHYWETFDFTDSMQVFTPQIGEQLFADYLTILPYAAQEQAAKSLHDLLDRATAAGQTVLGHFTLLCEKYLAEPNSPYRNEELYIPVLRYIIAAPGVGEIEKIRPRYQLAMALKNRPGMIATDFIYTTPDARTKRLSAVKGEYTLLLFYNPDCEDCTRVKEYIAASPVFRTMTDNARLALLALYPEGDLELWRSNLKDMPRNWTVGCDPRQTIHEKELYELRALPTLYLLDASKRIFLKDASVEQIEAYLTERNSEK